MAIRAAIGDGNSLPVYTHDGDSTVDGAEISNPATALHAVGGSGDDRFRGGAGADWFFGYGGRNVFRSSPGGDNFLGGAGANVYLFDPSFTGTCGIGQTNLTGDTILLQMPDGAPAPDDQGSVIYLGSYATILYATSPTILVGHEDDLLLNSGGTVEPADRTPLYCHRTLTIPHPRFWRDVCVPIYGASLGVVRYPTLAC